MSRSQNTSPPVSPGPIASADEAPPEGRYNTRRTNKWPITAPTTTSLITEPIVTGLTRTNSVDPAEQNAQVRVGSDFPPAPASDGFSDHIDDTSDASSRRPRRKVLK